MAKSAYIGVNGAARKVKKLYIGVNGTARKVKKAYVGDAQGLARLFFQEMETWQRYEMVYSLAQEFVDSGNASSPIRLSNTGSSYRFGVTVQVDRLTGELLSSGGTSGGEYDFRDRSEAFRVISSSLVSPLIYYVSLNSATTYYLQHTNSRLEVVPYGGSASVYQYKADGPVKGSLIGTVEAPPGTYPDGGAGSDGYYYIKV